MKNGYYSLTDKLNILELEFKEQTTNRINKYKHELEECKNEDSKTEASQHDSADESLCDLLDELGYQEVTKIFKELNKWYS